MKKLAFLGAIAASACALAEVTSSNVVGYQAKKVTGNTVFNFICGQFNPRIGQDIKTASMKLGDIVPNNWERTTDTLKVLNRTAGVSAEYTYLSKELAAQLQEDWGVENLTGGWYIPEDLDNEEITDFAKYNKNEVELPMTQGFSVQMSSPKGEVVFAGEVLAADQPIALYGNTVFNFTGNFSPADITLGDIVMNDGWERTTDSLKLLTNQFAIQAEYTYISAKKALELTEDWEVDGLTAGWYKPEDLDNEEITDFSAYNYNSVAIPAGQAFIVQTAGTKTTMTIPTALPAATQD